MPKIPYNKRKDGRYYKQIIIGVDANGKRKTKTLYDRDWRVLDKKVREFMLELNKGNYIEEDITLGECITMWLKTKVNISISTKNNYEYALKKLDCISFMKMREIKPIHLQTIFNDLYVGEFIGALKTLRIVTHSIFEFAENNNFVKCNIAEKIQIPRIKSNKRRSLTDTEKNAINQAFEIFNDFEKYFVAIALCTGMRRNEILALKKSDIHFEEGYIDVNKTLTSGEHFTTIVKNATKTQAGMRKVPMVPQLKQMLKDFVDNKCIEDEYLFLTKNHNFVQASLFDYRWKKIKEKINLFMPKGQKTDISPHYFRHNFATEMVYANIPIKTVQYIMGHEGIGTTMNIYTDVKLDILDTAEKLKGCLSRIAE